jgi:hypothetical protein
MTVIVISLMVGFVINVGHMGLEFMANKNEFILGQRFSEP